MGILDILILFSTGLAAGFLSGFLGIGGGVIAVPVLVYFLSGTVEPDILFLTASTISLGVVFFASSNSAIKHIKSHNYYKKAIVPVALGSILGPVPGSWICAVIPDKGRMLIFSVTLGLLAVRIFFLDNEDEDGNPKKHPRFSYPVMFLSGLFMGTVSAMTGIGGGSILVPLLAVILHFNIKKAVGLASIVMIFNAVSSLAGRYFIGAFDSIPSSLFFTDFLLISLGASFTAQLGANMNIRSGYKSFKKIAGAVYLIVALQVLIKAL